MSRIRSIHPGFFTDEVFVNCSFASRLFIQGVWCECDDFGVFEWKPLTLKMRILPADNVDVNIILGELVTHNVVKQIEVDGVKYGLVRNFCKYQRPKKPTNKYKLPNTYYKYVGMDVVDEVEVDNQFPTSTEPVPHQYGTSSPPVRNQFPKLRILCLRMIPIFKKVNHLTLAMLQQCNAPAMMFLFPYRPKN